MFTYVIVAVALAASSVRAQEGEVMVSDNKTQCISQMVQWCDGMKYPQQGAGMAMLSLTYGDSTGFFRVYCASDSDGTNCTKNGTPWFACSGDNILTYNGKPLTADVPSQDVDDKICDTADRAFNDLFVQNLSYDNTTLKNTVEKGMEAFFEQLAYMQEQIELLQSKLASFPSFSSNFWDGFLFDLDRGTDRSVTTDTSVPTEQGNQIERE